MEFVNLKTFNTEPEAEIFRIFLEQYGIEGYIFDSNSSTIYPMLNNSIGGFQLKIKTEDAEKAKKLMAEFYEDSSEYEAE